MIDFLERPAKGWDVRAEGYLPAYSQLGGRVAFEQYYGKDVSLFSADERQKDPRAFTVGVIYNPVPLIGLSVDHRMGQAGLSDTTANLSFNYRFGEPLSKQLASAGVADSHRLKNMRYDLVSRNNEIVLDHKYVETQLRLPAVINASAATTVKFAIIGANNLRSLSWVGSAAGFALPYNGSGIAELNVPAYAGGAISLFAARPGESSNTYTLQLVGTDRNGRAVVSNWMSVVVEALNLAVTASPASIVADGSSASTISTVVNDAKGSPLANVT